MCKQASKQAKQASKPAASKQTRQPAKQAAGCTCFSSAILRRLSSFFLRLDCLFSSEPASLSLSPSSASGYSTDSKQLSNHAETPIMLMCNTCSSHSLADRSRQETPGNLTAGKHQATLLQHHVVVNTVKQPAVKATV